MRNDDTMRGAILQQYADNEKHYNALRAITRGIPMKRLKEICDEERKREKDERTKSKV